ncbi:PREDICTED: protein scarlet-like, partial [Ceratosolen solmsi marchali]|uniref:Protein scarlet-like n=1 Tax=Ceratosolen solmsi marchali TaxID=326594 RepID=A0AAJ7E172_9HYME
PSILFLDEPTTGQDAYTANILINQLQLFATHGRIVLCTIHQPSSITFSSFDKIILVANGRIAFSGTSKQAVTFFSGLGYLCPHTYNVADFLVTTLVTSSTLEYHSGKPAERICDAFLVTDECKEIDLILQLELYMSESNKSVSY